MAGKRKVGRPSKYTDALANEICKRIADGMDLIAICKLPQMPDRTTVHAWLADQTHADFATEYARAREAQADSNEAKINSVADKCEAGKIEPEAARVVINAHTWLAKVRNPKRYSDKVSQEISGPNGGPIQGEYKLTDLMASFRAASPDAAK